MLVIAAKLGTRDREIIRAVDSLDFESKRGEYMEAGSRYWPLIELVKIRCKAQALSKGTVLVDLPGIGDSNAARSAITLKYIKNCHSIWIVAEGSRACDNALAKGYSLELSNFVSFERVKY